MASGSAQALRDKLTDAFLRRGESWVQYCNVCSACNGMFAVRMMLTFTYHACCLLQQSITPLTWST